MVIVALDHVPHCFSQDDGIVIHDLLAPCFAASRSITLSFAGVEDVTSSFVNSALVPFVERYGADYVKAQLRVTRATKQVADTILRCFANAERLAHAA